jgi:omega-3 fatty acid desaturase (delta-15 desaturase)
VWVIFMIGHDCGHGSFSEYESVNAFFGHVCHGALLVPFWPWALSHHRHHLYHNHVEKDYSHPWYTPEKMLEPESGMARMVQSDSLVGYTARLVFPIVGWHMYLLGFPDGNHYIPNKTDRLWIESTPISEVYKCFVSTSVVVAFGIFWFYAMGATLAGFAYYYLAPYCVYSWWVVSVTYLQHHTPGTVVYDNNTWTFVTAAFETVDRRFGWGLDDLMHNITDGHVVHHLFFKHIPHYNLKAATVALRDYLDKAGVGDMYKFVDTPDFPYRVHKTYFDYGLTGMLVDSTHVSASHDAAKLNLANAQKKAL